MADDSARTRWATPNAPELFHDFLFLGFVSFYGLHLLLQYCLFDGVRSSRGGFLQLLFLLLLLLLQSFGCKDLLPCEALNEKHAALG